MAILETLGGKRRKERYRLGRRSTTRLLTEARTRAAPPPLLILSVFPVTSARPRVCVVRLNPFYLHVDDLDFTNIGSPTPCDDLIYLFPHPLLLERVPSIEMLGAWKGGGSEQDFPAIGGPTHTLTTFQSLLSRTAPEDGKTVWEG